MTKQEAVNILVSTVEGYMFDLLEQNDPEHDDIRQAIKKLQAS